MRLHQLAHELDVRRVADLQQHDRQVAGDRVAPQARLAAPVLAISVAGVGAQRGVRVEHRAREAAVELRVGLGGVELAQRHLAVGPRQLEHAVGEMAVLVLVDEREARVARLGRRRRPCRWSPICSGSSVMRQRIATIGSSTEPCAARERRVAASRAGAASVRPRPMKRARSVSYDDVADVARRARPSGGTSTARARRPSAAGACRGSPARSRDDLGLHEQVAERRVQRVGRRRREHDLGVAGDLDRARVRARGW